MEPKLFDSHAHLNFKAFNDSWQQTITDCQKQDVEMVCVGGQLKTSQKAVEIADQYQQGVNAAIGLHPIHAPGSQSNPEEFDYQTYKDLAQSSTKVVAIGETGIDFFHDENTFDSQRGIFLQQIKLAQELDLALIVHGRSGKDGSKNAYDKIYDTLKDHAISRGVIHCYGGTWEEAQRFVDLGLSIGFTGIITFPKTDSLAETAKNLPLDRILIETDCPYLAPAPHRGEKNIPQYVKYVAEKIAEIRQISYNEIAEQTRQNALALFNLT